MEYIRIGIVDDPHRDRGALLPWQVPPPPKVPATPPARWLRTFDGGRSTDGRLIDDFRVEARRKSAPVLMALAALKWVENPDYSRVFADLAVTGRAAKASFDAATKADVDRELARLPLDVPDASRRIDAIWQHALDLVAYLEAPEDVRETLPIGKDGRRARWIGVCADADAPWRPVNVGCTRYRQLDVRVQLSPRFASGALTTRAIVAGDPARARRWVLYLHGGGSRAEECEGLADALLALSRDEETVLVSPDLPGCGYAERVSSSELGLDPKKKLRRNAEEKGPFPYLEMLDEFAGRFVDAVGRAEPALAGKPLAAVCGGSLGGNLTLRAAWRGHVKADTYFAWSPASLWDPLDDPIGLKNMGPAEALKMAAMGELESREDPDKNNDARRRFFWQTFEFEPPLNPPNAEMWWDEHWPARQAYIDAARHDRQEIYGEQHRRFAWRYSYEQLYFSFQTKDRGGVRRLAIERPVVLLAGTGDNFHFSNIFDRVMSVGLGREPIPGAQRVVLLGRTGHSIHDERPDMLARELHAALS